MDAADSITRFGVKVHEAATSGEALRILQDDCNIRLLFTDTELPDGDGVALARKVHAIRPDVELIVTSGAVSLSDDDLPDSGTFLAKPYRTPELVKAVREKLTAANEG